MNSVSVSDFQIYHFCICVCLCNSQFTFFPLYILLQETSDISFTWENLSHLLFQTPCQRIHTSIPRRIFAGKEETKINNLVVYLKCVCACV